jgi:hypothetical protein
MLAGSLTAGSPVRQRADGMMASLRPVRRYLLAAHAAPGRSICIVSNGSDVRGYRTISRNGRSWHAVPVRATAACYGLFQKCELTGWVALLSFVSPAPSRRRLSTRRLPGWPPPHPGGSRCGFGPGAVWQ